MAAIVPLTLNNASGVAYGANFSVNYFIPADTVFYIRDNEPLANLAERDNQVNSKLTEVIGYCNVYAGDGLAGAGDQPLDLDIGTCVEVHHPANFILGAPAGSADVSALMAGKTPNGSGTTPGVLTIAPYNLVAIKMLTGDDLFITDAAFLGAKCYGRLTYAAAVWTLTFYALSLAGVETAVNFGAGAHSWYVLEAFNPWARPFPPEPVAPESGRAADLRRWEANGGYIYPTLAGQIVSPDVDGDSLGEAATPLRWNAFFDTLRADGATTLNGISYTWPSVPPNDGDVLTWDGIAGELMWSP